jgi:uncharacterized membrane protein (DUF2068 family)
MPTAASKPHEQSPALLITIAVFKLIQCALLILVSIATLRLAHGAAKGDLLEDIHRWIRELHINPDGHLVNAALAKLLKISERQLHWAAVGTFVYAGLFGVEGVGLLTRQRWAEYFVIITTSLLIPLEIYEVYEHVSIGRIVILIANAAIVVYLIVQVRRTAKKCARGSCF